MVLAQLFVMLTADHSDNRSLDNRAKQELKNEEDEDRAARERNNDPLAPAQWQGNEPSKGAKIDAELQREEAEILKKKGGFKGMS